MWEQQFCVPQWAFREEREYGLLHVGVQPDGLLHRFVSVFADRVLGCVGVWPACYVAVGGFSVGSVF